MQGEEQCRGRRLGPMMSRHPTAEEGGHRHLPHMQNSFVESRTQDLLCSSVFASGGGELDSIVVLPVGRVNVGIDLN